MYLDDSGTRPTHYIALATAIIIPTALLVRLEREWQSLCAKEGFEYFHASPCNSGKKPFDGWDEEKIDRVFARTRQISKKYGAIAISAAVNKKYYDDEMPEEYRKYNGAYHYTWWLDLPLLMQKDGELCVVVFMSLFNSFLTGSIAMTQPEWKLKE